MTNREFEKVIKNLSYKGGGYSNWVNEKMGFDYCKEKVLELLPNLDIEGMLPEAFKTYQTAMDNMNNVYTQLFQIQEKLVDKNYQLLMVEQQKKDLTTENCNFRHFIEKNDLWKDFHNYIGDNKEKPNE